VYRALVEEIADDRLSGASGLAAKGAAALAAFALECSVPSADEFWDELVALARALRQAQPAMAPLLHLADRALRAAQDLEDVDAMRAAVQRAAEAFETELRSGAERIAQAGAALVMDGATVVTVSHSSAVASALLHARQDGKRLRVICPESRPLYEGRELARRLAAAGVEVTLALAAQAHAVPLYALAGGEKFWPPGVEPEIESRAPGEVWPDPAPGVIIVNRYFEAVPLALFTGLVTVTGIFPPDEVHQQVSALVVHPALTE